MNTATKSSDITSIAEWERRYLPNGEVLESIDFDSERVDEELVDMIARELIRPVEPVQSRKRGLAKTKGK